jgi:hypothetical protein
MRHAFFNKTARICHVRHRLIVTQGITCHAAHSAFIVIRVFDEAGNVIETHEHEGDFKKW